MTELILDNCTVFLRYDEIASSKLEEIIQLKTRLPRSEYYLTQNGKRLPQTFTQSGILAGVPVRLQQRLLGGKGGFGSMLRAIGAQIEKTTNREACRDLSGRRLRDINEEKRLKAYLEKQKETPEDEAAKLQKKVSKLLSKPKHEFHDEDYNRARSDLTQNVDEAVQEGFKKAIQAEKSGEGVKRKPDAGKDKTKAKKLKGSLWLGADDLGSSSDSDSDSGSDSACSSRGESSSASSSAKHTVTSEEEKSNLEASTELKKEVEAATQ